MKIHPMGVELFRAGGQTERYDEANYRFEQNNEKYTICDLMFL